MLVYQLLLDAPLEFMVVTFVVPLPSRAILGAVGGIAAVRGGMAHREALFECSA